MSDENGASEPVDQYDAFWNGGYVTAMAQITAGEAWPLDWDGRVHGDRLCEVCGQTFPECEYGVILRDDLWTPIAPRPAEGFFGSGVLCLDCVEASLGREVEVKDVATLNHYGKRPTFRVAMLATIPYIAFAEHLCAPDDEQEQGQ